MQPQSIIEFIGIPGAGKTALASMLHERISRSCSAAFPDRHEYRRRKLSRAERVVFDLRYAPTLLAYRVRRIADEFRRNGYGRSSFLKGWTRSRYPALLFDYIARNQATVVILDEWLVHRTIDEALRMYPDDVQFCRRFGTIPVRGRQFCYVWVDLDPETAFDRISRQDQPYRKFVEKMNDSAVASLLNAWHRRLACVREEIVRRGVPILAIDGRREVAANVELIADWLEAGMRRVPDPPQGR